MSLLPSGAGTSRGPNRSELCLDPGYRERRTDTWSPMPEGWEGLRAQTVQVELVWGKVAWRKLSVSGEEFYFIVHELREGKSPSHRA